MPDHEDKRLITTIPPHVLPALTVVITALVGIFALRLGFTPETTVAVGGGMAVLVLSCLQYLVCSRSRDRADRADARSPNITSPHLLQENEELIVTQTRNNVTNADPPTVITTITPAKSKESP